MPHSCPTRRSSDLRYHYVQGHPEKMRVISCAGAFHGRTLTTLSAAGNPKYLEGTGPVAEGFDLVPFGNMNELRNAIRPETAAVLVEPIQGDRKSTRLNSSH